MLRFRITLMRILIRTFTWCGPWSQLSKKGSKPWKTAQIVSYAIGTFWLVICKLTLVCIVADPHWFQWGSESRLWHVSFALFQEYNRIWCWLIFEYLFCAISTIFFFERLENLLHCTVGRYGTNVDMVPTYQRWTVKDLTLLNLMPTGIRSGFPAELNQCGSVPLLP